MPAGAAAKFVAGDITQALPAGSFDAITDTHTISTLPDAAATLALVRSALQPTGIFVSVLAHATAASTAQFAHALAAAGLHVHKLEFVFGTDLGQTAAHPLLLAAIIERGMVRSGRLARIRISARDVPGALARIVTTVADAGANVEEVHHQRAFTMLAAQNVEIELVLQTRGKPM